MSLKPLHRVGISGVRNALRSNISATPAFGYFARTVQAVSQDPHARPIPSPRNVGFTRSFHSSQNRAGIMPDTSEPAPKESEASETATAATHISTSEYHKLADDYLDKLVHRLEEEQDARQDLEVEYSAGVLEVSIGTVGTYVLNKQPPNKQIWLASPESGPKRFDWVVTGESMNQKEGSGKGDWIYLRDGSSLTELIRKEFGVDLGTDDEAPK